MKRIFLIFLISLIGFPLLSQKSKITWGSKYKKDGGKDHTVQLLGVTDGHYFVLCANDIKGTLSTFDMKHKLVDKIKIKKNTPLINKLLSLNDNTYGFFKKLNSKNIMELSIGKYTNGKFETPKKFFEHPFKIRSEYSIVMMPYGRVYNSDKLHEFNESTSKQYFVYSNVLHGQDKYKEEESRAIAVIDANMNLKWSKIQIFPYKDGEFYFEQTIVTDDGKVYCLAKVKNKASSRRSPSTYSYKIFEVKEDGLIEYEIKLEDNQLIKNAILIQGKNTINVVGYFTDDKKENGLQGVFQHRITSQSGVEYVNSHKFDNKFLEEWVDKKDLAKGIGLIGEHSIDQGLVFLDGSFGFISEYGSTFFTGSVQKPGAKVYNTGSLIVSKFNEEGKTPQIYGIRKGIASSNMRLGSYNTVIKDNNIYLFYNTTKSKNERKKLKGNRFTSFTDKTVINEDGTNQKSSTIFNSNEQSGFHFSSQLFGTTNNILLFGTQSITGNTYRFGTMKY